MQFLFMMLMATAAMASDKDDIVALVQKTFDAMSKNDSPAIESCFLKEARLVAIRESGEVSTVDVQTFSARIASSKAKLLERMWNPEVRIDGRLASLWTPYDFHRDGKRTHCGVDQVDLVKTAEGWRIASLVYNVVTSGCPVSPLGPIN